MSLWFKNIKNINLSFYLKSISDIMTYIDDIVCASYLKGIQFSIRVMIVFNS